MNEAYLWSEEDAPVADIEEWATLMSLSKRADPDGCNAYQSYPTIARRARIDAKTVYRRCKEMEKRGILKRGDQSVVAHIRADERPVVWDIQIPYSWFPNLKRINAWRAEHGKGPLTPEDRPDLGPAPEKKRRADAGKPRPKKNSVPREGTSSPVADGLAVQPSESGETDDSHGLQVPPDSESSRAWTSSPTSSSLGSSSSRSFSSTTPPPSPQQADDVEKPPARRRTTRAGRKSEVSSEIEDQEPVPEWKDPRFYPELTEWEQALHERCMDLRKEWSPRVLRKVIGSSAIRERTAVDPDLVWLAFEIGAQDRRKGTYRGTLPGRMPHDGCPHWATAAEQLEARRARTDSAPAAEPEPAPSTTEQHPVPEQRPSPDSLAVTTPAPPNEAIQQWRQSNAARRAAAAAAAAAEEARRDEARRLVLADGGVPVT
ncbi:Lrp/AsnC family transcriptional regulator [Micromonospora tulbaghiae]|uniref:Lrp/AsnC family transcriptional regulator n=1 Tax=Micromonospora tulbaghiae TaxID=479978 RepID=UPI00331FD702